MPGEGFTFNMIAQLKRCNSVSNRKSYFDTKKDFIKVSIKVKILDPRKATPVQLLEIRKKFKRTRIEEFVKLVLGMIISILLTIGILMFIAFRVKKGLID